LGTVSEITSESGAVVQKYDYSSFGKIYSITDGAGSDITSSPVLRTTYTYTGREYEEESGLFYYRARYYDPGVGRFLQKDPDPGRLSIPSTITNRYVYTGNSPVSNRDPSGMSWFSDQSGVDIDLNDVGHRLVADIGAAVDRLVKNPGFQFVALLVIGSLTGTMPAVLGSVGFGAFISGMGSWYNGNRSIDSFLSGVQSYATDPTALRYSAALGLVGAGLGFAASGYFGVDEENIKFAQILLFWQGNSSKTNEMRMSKDERAIWNVTFLYLGAWMAMPSEGG
jgi:RHS repeat-associated protein